MGDKTKGVSEKMDYRAAVKELVYKHYDPDANEQEVYYAILALLDKVRQEFLPYGHHLPTCKFREWECSQPDCGETHSTPCSCGWAALGRK